MNEVSHFSRALKSNCLRFLHLFGRFAIPLALFFAIYVLLSNNSKASEVYPIPLDAYPKCDGLWETLSERTKFCRMNIYVTIIFACAIIHTFCYRIFLKLAESVHLHRRLRLRESSQDIVRRIFSLLGEVEIVFALWLIPLFVVFYWEYGWKGLANYIDNLAYEQDKYSEPVFVMVVMCIAATRPIVIVASKFISLFAKLGQGSIRAWWFSIICVGSLLGSLITEPAAIAICATLLSEKFFAHKPSIKFKSATLALLFVSISVGGALTQFAAPPIVMVARSWDWDTYYMFTHFGWKSALSIVFSALFLGYLFRSEFAYMETIKIKNHVVKPVEELPPNWILCAHMFFLFAAVAIMHYLVMELFLLLTFIAFTDITQRYQNPMCYRSPMLVAIFLGALVTHGSLQAWWLEPVLKSFNAHALFAGSIFLTSFNDNAAITYLASLVPGFTEEMRYFVVAGAIGGGGLTVIANAPNLVAMSILKVHFKKGIPPYDLFKWALIPTCIVSIVFYLTF